jgi:YD repeat-containing protein
MVGRVTDTNGNATLYTYDGRGRILTMTQEGNGATTYVYNAAGDITGIAQPNGVTFNFAYDVLYGRLIRVEDTLGNYTRLSYDSQGNRIELARYNAGGQLVFRKRFDYQTPGNPGKLWKEINPDDTYTEYGYNLSGNMDAITDPSGKTTSYNYDLLNRLFEVNQPGNVITAYTYDAQNNLAGVTDAENHTTTYIHDDLGRLGVVASPDTGTTTFFYDAVGNLIDKNDAIASQRFISQTQRWTSPTHTTRGQMVRAGSRVWPTPPEPMPMATMPSGSSKMKKAPLTVIPTPVHIFMTRQVS